MKQSPALFSPYEIAAAGIAGFYFFFAVTVWSGATLAMLMAVISGIIGWLGGRCPECGKPALKLYLANRQTGIWSWWFVSRWWPERECSSCRAPLDVA
ncbi:hypothetical protein [Allosphingosinicella indica]|uniref:Uncharacterized protein n=1 Tax=Allosphingosinicella indica TaxID=941907 RepID=A0A1X7GAJ4_9SPHN|nr:hypothetical protein [Allosphingosinicella indica]SMF66635.1 hypothetical protein SAMN06295910_1423 [Allosphingosinicella indica]